MSFVLSGMMMKVLTHVLIEADLPITVLVVTRQVVAYEVLEHLLVAIRVDEYTKLLFIQTSIFVGISNVKSLTDVPLS